MFHVTRRLQTLSCVPIVIIPTNTVPIDYVGPLARGERRAPRPLREDPESARRLCPRTRSGARKWGRGAPDPASHCAMPLPQAFLLVLAGPGSKALRRMQGARSSHSRCHRPFLPKKQLRYSEHGRLLPSSTPVSVNLPLHHVEAAPGDPEMKTSKE